MEYKIAVFLPSDDLTLHDSNALHLLGNSINASSQQHTTTDSYVSALAAGEDYVIKEGYYSANGAAGDAQAISQDKINHVVFAQNTNGTWNAYKNGTLLQENIKAKFGTGTEQEDGFTAEFNTIGFELNEGDDTPDRMPGRLVEAPIEEQAPLAGGVTIQLKAKLYIYGMEEALQNFLHGLENSDDIKIKTSDRSGHGPDMITLSYPDKETAEAAAEQFSDKQDREYTVILEGTKVGEFIEYEKGAPVPDVATGVTEGLTPTQPLGPDTGTITEGHLPMGLQTPFK